MPGCDMLALSCGRLERQRAMIILNNVAAQSLFRSVSDDGTEWLFVIQSDDRWSITCNGDPVTWGTGTRRSIASGVERLRNLSDAVTSPRGPRCCWTLAARSACNGNPLSHGRDAAAHDLAWTD